MEMLNFDLFRFPTSSPGPTDPTQMHHEIVEISSDEDEVVDDGQPESSRRVTQSAFGAKRVMDIDSDEEDIGTQLDMLHRFLEPARNKRQKFSHAETFNHLEPRFDIDQFMDYTTTEDPQTESTDHTPIFTKVDVSFNRRHDDNDRATLVFRPVPCPSKVKTATQTAKLKQAEKDRLAHEIAMEREKRKLSAPPYYDDPKFETRMYCGPGYERFPIVLGTISEHQDVCDEWDRQQVRKNARLKQELRADMARYDIDMLDASDNTKDTTSAVDDETSELECLCRIREVLPDIQRAFALDRIREHMQTFRCNVDSDVQIQPDPAAIVAQILELSEYPKQTKATIAKEPAVDGTGVTIEWHKGDVESKTYQRDAVCLLAGHFERIPTHFIYKIVQEKESLFDSYQRLHTAELNYEKLSSKERPYRRSTNARIHLEKKYTSKSNELRSKTQWERLINELQAAKQRAERAILRLAREEHEAAAEEANLQAHKASGSLIECQCCFDEEIPINRAVSCEDKDMHWFCFACILGLAENQVGSMKHEMSCMHQNGCKAKLSRDGIIRAVPVKLFDKLAFYQQQFEIASACIEGLEQCPHCDFKAICDPIEQDSIFQCQNPDCGRVSCRKCHEDSHLPKTCEEVKVDKRISARHRVEEARSEAMMRSCPKCKVKIIKEIGCNKMRCAKCGCVMCYVCKTDISHRKDGGYGHFNDTGAKCILYDKDFDRHEMEADEAEKEAIKKVQAEDADIDEKQLRIETGAPTKKPAPKKDELGYGWGHAFDPAAFPVVFQPLLHDDHDAFNRDLIHNHLRLEEFQPPRFFGDARRAAWLEDMVPPLPKQPRTEQLMQPRADRMGNLGGIGHPHRPARTVADIVMTNALPTIHERPIRGAATQNDARNGALAHGTLQAPAFPPPLNLATHVNWPPRAPAIGNMNVGFPRPGREKVAKQVFPDMPEMQNQRMRAALGPDYNMPFVVDKAGPARGAGAGPHRRAFEWQNFDNAHLMDHLFGPHDGLNVNPDVPMNGKRGTGIGDWDPFGIWDDPIRPNTHAPPDQLEAGSARGSNLPTNAGVFNLRF